MAEIRVRLLVAVKGSAQVGFAYKITLVHKFNDQVKCKISHARFDLLKNIGGENSSETNVDITYRLKGVLEGLSIQNRFGIIRSDLAREEFLDNRLQMQYDFNFESFL